MSRQLKPVVALMSIAAALLFAWADRPCAAAEAAAATPNLEYGYWAHFKPGTTVTLTAEMDAGGAKITSEVVKKLIEVKADKLVIEQSATMVLAGQERKTPAKQRDVPAKDPKKAEIKEIGTEEIEAGGKKYKCKVLEGETDVAAGPAGQPAGKAKAKLWVNETVPGGAVKMVVTTPRGNMTFTLKSFDAK
jgi:hypothetical protein